MATKILVVGAVAGQLQKAFQKISKLHTKTDFALALVVGDLFSNENSDEIDAILNGSIEVPLPTYFTLGDQALPSTVQERIESKGEVCPNLIFLGRKGTLTTTDGIKIVYLGGRQVQSEGSLTQSIGNYDPLYLENEAKGLHGAHSAHILLTNQWPTNIANGSNIALPESVDLSLASQSVSNLCATLKPRYHFSSSLSSSWSREPFLWPKGYDTEDVDQQVTRFTSLASVLTSNKEWMSAFTLDPSKLASAEGAQRAAPFTTGSPKRKRAPENSNKNYRYDAGDQDENNWRGRGGHRNKRSRRQPQNPDDCFMCLGKDSFDAKMVVSIGDEAFCTVLRGPLPLPTTFPQLESSGNLMIIPMYHAADEFSHGQRSSSEMQTEFAEMTHFRRALYHCLQTKSNGELGAVCWEVNRTGIRHFHWQFIACPSDMIKTGLVDAAYRVAAEKSEYEKFEPCDPATLIQKQKSDYFRVWIWTPADKDTSGTVPTKNGANSAIEEADALANGHDDHSVSLSVPANSHETSMFFPISPNQRFNISFGREVMAGLLKLETRTDWRDVPSKQGDEEADAQAWKRDFGEWDFAMA